MSDFIKERERVLKVCYTALENCNNIELDNFARELLELPPRPANHMPFVGWLTKEPEISSMTTSQAGKNLIKRWEGLRLNAYRCPAGKWTIGYGHTHTAKRGMSISKFEAERLLTNDLKIYEEAVKTQVTVPLTQYQFDALVSFTYNLGRGALSQSSLLRKLNQGKYNEAANWFSRYVYAGKVKLQGLINRRAAEKKMFQGE